MIVLTPQWEEEVRRTYRPNLESRNLGTGIFERNNWFNKRFLEYIARERGKENLNILYVGLGTDYYNQRSGCASDFFEFGDALENAEFSYKITGLDRERSSLEVARTRTTIYRGDYVERERTSMPINPSFLKKREEGKVTFQEGDIVIRDRSQEERYDIVHCLNVFCHAGSPENVTLGLYNIGRMMRKNGLLLVDDWKIGETATNIEEKISMIGEEIGLKIRTSFGDIIEETDKYNVYVVGKV